MTVYVVTPAGGRPQGLALLGEYLNEQTYRGPIVWVVVDDCEPVTRVPRVRHGIEVVSVRPDWVWRPGMNTQGACMVAGLDHVPDGAKVLVLEDDDVYLPPHVETIVRELDTVELVGERVSRYYNVATDRSCVLPGSSHASLSSTGVQGKGLQLLVEVCRTHKKMLDFTLWRTFKGPKRLLETANVVGIKGLPGRPGIGVGHKDTFGKPAASGVLEQWIGEYAANYSIFRKTV